MYKSKTVHTLQHLGAMLSLVILSLGTLLPSIIFSPIGITQENPEIDASTHMLESHKYLIAMTQDGTYLNHPPLLQWINLFLSKTLGEEVNGVIAHIPSILAFSIFVLAFFLFLIPRIRYRESYLASIIMLSTVALHHSALSITPDVLYLLLSFLALIFLFRWEDRSLVGLPWSVPILLGLSALSKGISFLLLPILCFSIYLLTLRKYTFKKILKVSIYILLLSGLIPMIWFMSAYENLSGDSLLSMKIPEWKEALKLLHFKGHIWDNAKGGADILSSLFIGYLPWISILPFVLLDLSGQSKRQRDESISEKKTYKFSYVGLFTTLLLSLLYGQNGEVAILMGIPFMSLIIASKLVASQRTRGIILWGYTITIIGAIVALTAILLFLFPQLSFEWYDLLYKQKVITSFFLLLLLASVFSSVYQSYRQNYTKTIYANIFILLCLILLYDSTVMVTFNKSKGEMLEEQVQLVSTI